MKRFAECRSPMAMVAGAKLMPGPTRMEQFSLAFVPERRIYSLRELSDGIRGALETRFNNIWVSGEISGSKPAPSGHCYFILKDSEAQIKCVCWKLSYM